MSKRTIIAFVIIGIIFLFYDDYLRWLYPPAPETGTDSTAVATTETGRRETKHAGRGEYYLRSSAEDSLRTVVEEKRPVALMEKTESLPERFVTIKTSRFRARFTSAGARLVSFRLEPNGRYLLEEEELSPPNKSHQPSFRFWTYDGPVETNGMEFRLAGDDDGGDREYRVGEGETRRIEFTTSLSDDRSLSVIYTFNGDDYTFNCRLRGVGLEKTWVRDYAEVYWDGGLAYTEPDTAQDYMYSKAYVYFEGDEMETQKINSKKDVMIGPLSGATRWGAIRTKYFMAALIPEAGEAVGGWLESRHDSTLTGRHHPNRLGVGLRLPLVNGVPNTPIKVFVGPIDYDVLGSVDPSLRRTMNWGWKVIAPFSKGILWALKKLGHVVPNYGLCIIIFSILIKVIVWPLTRKSYHSMAAMQRLQPKIQQLREKYKSEPQRVQTEMMKLYKAEKVNPMGGCLPVMLQMPLLYGLFIVFRTTIEFRNAPFVFWIKDLSQPDIIFHLPMSLPLYGDHVALLPILMGISTFFQSKSTMTDPNQKMMLYFMPILMTLLFNQFPSGLTLYYTLFNLFTLIQQKITPPPKPAEVKSS